MKQIIDFHSHIIPGVDDGCPNMKEALQMVEVYKSQDVEAVICTPHYGSCMKPDADQVSAFTTLCVNAEGLKLYLGNEILYTPGALRAVQRGQARTMVGTNTVLVEFDEWGDYHTDASVILSGLTDFRVVGYDVVLAHAERYKALLDRPDLFQLIVSMGIKIQVNAWDVAGRDDDRIRRTTRSLLQHGYVSYLGGDSHGMQHRPPFLRDGALWIYDNCDTAYADAVVHDNALALIEKGEA